MKLFKKNINAFTLVELIVVITILVILGTITFINLQGYATGARDSKRLSDVYNIQKKIAVEVSKGVSLGNLIYLVKTNSGLIIDSTSGISIQGTANFVNLKENGANFKDPLTNGDYVLSYSIGGAGTGAYKFTQISTVNEELNQAVVKGNYYQMAVGDSPSIVKNVSNNFIVDEGIDLPYEVTNEIGGSSSSSSSSSSGGPVYSCDDTSKPVDNGHITYVVGTPTSVDQAYVQDALNCGYSCNDDYTGVDCNTPPVPVFSCGDSVSAGGYTYTTMIGLDGNCWTSQNMKHGTMLGANTMPSDINSIEKWCYSGDSNQCNSNGAFYSRSEAMGFAQSCYNADCSQPEDTTKSVCGQLGEGWSLPTDSQWATLASSGATGWTGNKLGSIVSSLPGYRSNSGGTYSNINIYGHWWTAYQSTILNGLTRRLNSTNSTITVGANNKNYGFSVICIKN